ncbi:maleylpyruvate isomerase family mycothiol-dependent enzyme [Auraticoccus monumenti]|uniref:TIGR03083 family protein n=1 Tax=Auraticoccus monumenti TaxID=675864 RepID=A0A1G6ZPJ6_9ACTN|nr:maleylpyruvate isomerase family mycothiol-dependent enzyme [Auraticoccus monumenti]SDE04469.1 TIGR03083 family protein [Auraticoccus monumenti]
MDQSLYLRAVHDESLRFRDALAGLTGTEPVPTCPGWDADDLLHHLTQVQLYWARVLADGLTTDDEVAALQPPPRDDHAGLLAGFEEANQALVGAVRGTAPDDHRWTWAPEQTAGFIHRRQAHEALVHRVDAELAAGTSPSPLEPGLAADGVDETLTVMFGQPPAGCDFTATPGQVVGFTAVDTGHRWLHVVGSFTDPREGTVPCLDLAPDGAEATAEVAGSAADLDLWLWHRPFAGPLSTSGDAATLAALQVVLDEPLS